MTNGEQTAIHEHDMDLTSWLNAPTGANVVTPESQAPGPVNENFFKGANDVSFVNPGPKQDDKEPATPAAAEAPADGDKGKDATAAAAAQEDKNKAPRLSPEQLKELNDIVAPGATSGEENDNTAAQAASQGGRPKSERSLLEGYLKGKIEAGEMMAFEDWDEKTPIEDYLKGLADKDLNELLDVNVGAIKDTTKEAYRKEFFESLPKDLQYAYQMFANGAEDLKPVWAALSQVAQLRELDPAKEADQPEIVRSYLNATNYGSPEEIEAEIEFLKNSGVLDRKAAQFKPKIDAMSRQMVEQQVRQQEEFNRRQQEAAKQYRDMTFKALQPGTLSGIKLDRKTQEALYNGLTRPQFPSITGDQTNELGYLLEKYQFVEPNLSLISEALWLLRDPEGYRKELRQAGANANTETQVRKLKTEQDRKGAGAQQQNFEHEEPKARKLPKVNPNFFRRA